MHLLDALPLFQMSSAHQVSSSVLLIFLFFCQLIYAIPTWEGMNGRSLVGSLIPGVSNIEAKGPVAIGPTSRHLTVQYPGPFGNLTVTSASKIPPPQFYINQEQLWLLVNETAVYPVNVHNSTTTHDLPMQLILETKRSGITSGSWRWKNTMLYYDLPSGKSNDGLFYRCLTDSGAFNVFMTFVPTQAPNGCQPMTLHSFLRNDKQ